MKKPKPIPAGTLRIKARDLKVYVKTGSGWARSSKQLPEAMHVIKLFRAHKNLDFLKDKKDPSFLKGMLFPDGKPKGARINILPDGRKLTKAYSLFAEQLTIHDETSNDHWDVLYHNPGGTYSYVYTLEKRGKMINKKYKAVDEFRKYYPKLKKNVLNALEDGNDSIAVPMFTLLKTYMRIGNEIYYKAHGHKGLTTLKKDDIKINGMMVTFDYIGKDGVPQNIKKEFPPVYIKRLSEILKPLKKESFVFVTKTGHPLGDVHFRKAFKKYCGKEFYPHIVRSYYATTKAKEFLKSHKKATKQEVKALFISIAGDLGHRKFDKKEQIWKENFNVSIRNYIQPDVVEKVKSLAE
jgi:hypothetical protein